MRPSPVSRPAAPPTAAPTPAPAPAELGAVVFPVEIAIGIGALFAIVRIPIVRIARENADVVVADASGLKISNGRSRVIVVVVKARNGDGHELLLRVELL